MYSSLALLLLPHILVTSLASSAVATPDHILAERTAVERHLHNKHTFQAWGRDATLDAAAARKRSMAAAVAASPATIRVIAEIQGTELLEYASLQLLGEAVPAMVRVLQKFVMVKAPSSAGLLVPPVCVASTVTGNGTVACLRYCPDFSDPDSNVDGCNMCGLATIAPAHMLGKPTCTLAASPLPTINSTTPAGKAKNSSSGNVTASFPPPPPPPPPPAYTNCSSSSLAGVPGLPADLVLYVTSVQDVTCADGAAAWGRSCMFDPVTNRPLMGTINVCPGTLAAGPLFLPTLVAILTHEATHALGFSDSMYGLYIAANGTELGVAAVTQTTAQLLAAGGGPVAGAAASGSALASGQWVVTPTVAAEAQAQFGCGSLAGARLEDQGGDGSANSHWEYDLFQGELMVASSLFAASGAPPRYSRITLAFLEDMGWYKAHWAAAGYMNWGHQQGCAFASLSCSALMAAQPKQPWFCNAGAVPATLQPSYTCTPDYQAAGTCRNTNFSGCGLVEARGGTQSCALAAYANPRPDVFGWSAGTAAARCSPVQELFKAFKLSSLSLYTYPEGGVDGQVDAACFDATCTSGGQLQLQILGTSVACPTGAYISLSKQFTRYTDGQIGPCPDNARTCATLSCGAAGCGSGAECWNGACYCGLTNAGPGCTLDLLQGALAPDAPPPPPDTQWVQVVEVALQLTNDAADFQARAGQFVTVLATWAAMAPSALQVVSVVAVNTAAAITVIAVNSTATGNSSITSSSGSSSAPAARRALQAAASTQLQIQVATDIHTGTLAAATALVAQLEEPQAVAALAAALLHVGFTYVNGSIASGIVVKEVPTPSPPPAPPTSPLPFVGSAAGHSGDAHLVLILAISISAAVAVVAAAVLAGACLRKRVLRQRQEVYHDRGGIVVAFGG